MLKGAKKVLCGWFWGWLAISAVMVVGMIICGLPHAQWMAAVILALFMLMPIRDWMYRLIVWAIEYVCSNHPSIKGKILKHATLLKLTEKDEKNRVDNIGFYRALKAACGTICLILALLWLVFQGTSFMVVYTWLHTLEFLFTGKLSFIALLFYVLLTLGFFYLVFWFIGQVLNGEIFIDSGADRGKIDWAGSWWKIALMIGGFYAKIIITGLLLKYTGSMIWHSLIFWTIVVGFPLLAFKIRSIISDLMHH